MAKQTKTTANKPATDATKKNHRGPTATKGNWDFSVDPKKDLIDDVPVGLGRQNNAQKLPFDWSAYAEQPKAVVKFVPLDFWTKGRGYKAEECKPTQVRDRLRRAFYGWQTAKGHEAEKRQDSFALTFSDQFDKDTKAYTGVNMYFQRTKPAGK